MIPEVTRYPSGWLDVRFPYDRSFVEALKQTVPSACRSWDPEEKLWTIGVAYADCVIRMLRYKFGHVHVTDHTAAPPPIRQTDPSFAALHLLPSAPRELVEAAYRCMSKLHHPDLGGSTSTMQQINGAYEDLRARGVA